MQSGVTTAALGSLASDPGTEEEMKSHILANDVVYLDLSVEEHQALAQAVRDEVGRLDDRQIELRLGMGADAARDFAYSVRMLEGSARADGIDWLGPRRPMDGAATTEPLSLSMAFSDDGSAWRLSVSQLWFVEACATSANRRESQAS